MSLQDYGLQKKMPIMLDVLFAVVILKYSTQGFQTFTQHSVIKQHKDVSKISFRESKTQKALSSTSFSKALPRPSLFLDAPLRSKVSAEEALWAFKVAE